VREPIAVIVHARDPVSQAGVAAQLREWPEVRVVEEGGEDEGQARVAVVVVDEVDEETTTMLRAVQRQTRRRVVLVATRLDDRSLLSAVECGASGLLRRSEATPAALVGAIRVAAAGDGTIPPDLLGRLLRQVERLQRQVLAPRGLNFSGLNDREVEVLRLVADGLDTGEIARHLSYSERTIKNVIHDVTTRLQLRNRSQAVAYALREGLI
jgi:DNA-binding NarL/FixJ family response regulator